MAVVGGFSLAAAFTVSLPSPAWSQDRVPDEGPVFTDTVSTSARLTDSSDEDPAQGQAQAGSSSTSGLRILSPAVLRAYHWYLDVQSGKRAIIVREVLTLVRPKYEETYNEVDWLDSTLPRSMTLPYRAQAEGEQANQPMPMGLLTFAGLPPNKPISIELRVNLSPGKDKNASDEAKASDTHASGSGEGKDDKDPGRLLSAWPRPSTIQTRSMHWPQLTLSLKPTLATRETTWADHKESWLWPLTQTTRLVVAPESASNQQARFIVYDLTLKAGKPPKLTFKDGRYAVTPRSFDFQAGWILKSSADGKVRTASFSPTTKGQTSPPATPRERADLAAALEPIAQDMHRVGLGKPEIKQSLGVVRRYVKREQGQAVAVFRLPQRWLDARLSRNVGMQYTMTNPTVHTVRVPLVILLKADPEQAKYLKSLIRQLGADQWSKRRSAQATLAEFGQAAKATLENHTGDEDAEIAFRVRTLLEQFELDNKSKGK